MYHKLIFTMVFILLGLNLPTNIHAQSNTDDNLTQVHHIQGVRWDYDPYEGQDLWSRQVFLDDGTEWLFDENCIPAHTLIINDGDSVEVLSEGDRNYSMIFKSHYEMVLGDDGKTWEMIYSSEPKNIKFIKGDKVFWLR